MSLLANKLVRSIITAGITSSVFALAFPVPVSASGDLAYVEKDHNTTSSSKIFYRERFVDDDHGIPRVHAASIIESSNNRLLATWYAGSREGAKDVSIYISEYDSKSGKWGKDQKLFDRQGVQKSLGRYIKKLGNPVLGVDGQGRLWIYFVSVSAGGWSGSAINYATSEDQGKTWSIPKRFVTSPFFNVSTLVRTPPINFADGSIGLPVYHELLGKFGELLRFSADGEILAKHRMSWGTSTLQPSVVPLGNKRLLAFFRNAGNTLPGILISRSDDAGKNWSELRSTGLKNVDSSVAAILDNRKRLLLVFNNTITSRNVLSLAVSTDLGKSWKVVHDLENDKQIHNEHSYPGIIQDKQGNYHVVYTWLRKRIKHVQFSDAWLNNKIDSMSRAK